MIESLGTLTYELAIESLVASAFLWAAILLAIRLCHVKDGAWQARFFLLPVVLPIPLVLLVHLLVRPRLLGHSHTPLERLLTSAVDAFPWLSPIALGLVAVALLAVSAQAFRLLVTLYRQRKEWHHQQREQSPHWLRCNNALYVVAQRLQMSPPRVVLLKGKYSGSLALGSLGSYVLVSSNLAPLLDDRELESLLAHELGHIRRWDTLVDVLMGLAHSPFGLCPFVHWAYRRFSGVREEAVDDVAIRAGDPLALASCLIKAYRVSRGNPCIVPGSALLRSPHTIEHRIRRLVALHTTIPNPPRGHHWAFFAVILVTAALFLLAF
ncbi:MAG: M48 family metalloprotease [Chloroflexi bacterium]|nr:M48 family metalloprotease [Chloroflexota bacterium]